MLAANHMRFRRSYLAVQCSALSPRIVLRVFFLKPPRYFLTISKVMRSHPAAGSRVKNASQTVCPAGRMQNNLLAWHGGLRLAGSRDRSVNSSQGPRVWYGKAKHRKASSSCLGKREHPPSCLLRMQPRLLTSLVLRRSLMTLQV
jgi:hypothetical protein